MNVIERLKKHILVDGFHIVADLQKSSGTNIIDAETGELYIDCYSQFASQSLGWNHPSFMSAARDLECLAPYKIANSDMYTEVYANFVETFASITPDFKHYFFIEGGALGVENALKAAFDWKCGIDPACRTDDGNNLKVMHLREAFHGRTGYTLSLTNTGETKTKWFPKFNWPRMPNPKVTFPVDQQEIQTREDETLHLMETEIKQGHVAALIFETIQGEGGDNHFRPEFFQAVRDLTLRYDTMFILDEVQSGMGITGKWWAYEHYGIVPDMICFGKKSQVCGFCANERIDTYPENVFKQSGRINSTWGGNIVDMERARITIEIIKREGLLDNAAQIGEYFLTKLREINHPDLTNIRGKGLMVAVDLPTPERRDEAMQKLQKAVLALKCGTRSIRFRPCLTFSKQDVDDVVHYLRESLKDETHYMCKALS